jgi:hypothetical protein
VFHGLKLVNACGVTWLKLVNFGVSWAEISERLRRLMAT